MTTLHFPNAGIRALFTGLAVAYGSDRSGYDIDREEAERDNFEIGMKLIYQHAGRKCPAITLDTGNTDTLWHFTFGAYGWTSVFVWGDSDICDALEAAASELPAGYFSEPDYKEAAEDLGYEIDPEACISEHDNWEEITESAEADLTYTESGYLISHEWTANECTAEAALQWAFEWADRS